MAMVSTELLIDASQRLAPVVTLQGAWTTQSQLPNVAELNDAVISCDKFVHITAGDGFKWDSRLLAFILAAERLCSEHQKKLDISALPEAVQHLHELANAVEPNTTHPPEEHDHWAFLKDIWSDVVDTFTFVGEMCLATMRLFSGRSHMRLVDAVSCLNQAGPKAIAILSLLSVLVGMILAYLGMIQLSQFGAEVYVANLVAVGMVTRDGSVDDRGYYGGSHRCCLGR